MGKQRTARADINIKRFAKPLKNNATPHENHKNSHGRASKADDSNQLATIHNHDKIQDLARADDENKLRTLQHHRQATQNYKKTQHTARTGDSNQLKHLQNYMETKDPSRAGA